MRGAGGRVRTERVKSKVSAGVGCVTVQLIVPVSGGQGEGELVGLLLPDQDGWLPWRGRLGAWGWLAGSSQSQLPKLNWSAAMEA